MPSGWTCVGSQGMLPSQSGQTPHGQFGPDHIRATLNGTASVEDAARQAAVHRSLQRKPQSAMANCTTTPRHGKPTRSSHVAIEQSRITNPTDALTRFLRHVPCGTAAHSLAPRAIHQDPDQVRTDSAWHSTFPLFVAGQERGQACTTSKRRTLWFHTARRNLGSSRVSSRLPGDSVPPVWDRHRRSGARIILAPPVVRACHWNCAKNLQISALVQVVTPLSPEEPSTGPGMWPPSNAAHWTGYPARQPE